jgi:uncharacterized protein
MREDTLMRDIWRVAALTMMPPHRLRTALATERAWTEACARLGLASAQLRLGALLLDEGEASRAFAQFQKAAPFDIEARNMLGRCHENGWGTGINHQEALRHYRLAAEAGLDWAQYNLGHMLLSGIGVTRDARKALHWYGKAADQGHVHAMNLVGRLLEEGWGCVRDSGRALLWYRGSAKGGYFRGMFNCATLLAQRGCELGARYWLSRALSLAPEPTRSNMIATTRKMGLLPNWRMFGTPAISWSNSRPGA